MGDNSESLWGLLGLIGCIVVFGLVRRFFPVLSVIVLIIGGIVFLLLLLLVAFVIFLCFRKPKNEKVKEQDITAVLSKGRSNLMEIRRLAMRIRDQRVKGMTEEICKEADKVLKALREQPENISQVRQFFNYYLPTLKSILGKYGRMEESNTLTKELEENTWDCLENISLVTKKQYQSLFEDDILDLTVEMEVLTMLCKQDGLLDDPLEGNGIDLEYFPGKKKM